MAMKWASKSELSTYTYKIDLESLFSPIYHLVLELVRGNNQNKPFCEWAENAFCVEEITGRKQVERDVTEESFLIDIARFLEDYLYSKVDCLEKSWIKLLYRNKGMLIAPIKPKPSSDLIEWIKKSGTIGKFFELVSHEGISSSKDTLIKLMNEQHFGQSVRTEVVGPLKSTFIKNDIVEGCHVQPVDGESLWLCKAWQKKLQLNENTEYGEAIFTNIDGYGISVGEYLLSLETIDSFVKPDSASDYFWDMLCNIYALRKKNVSIFREKCSEFAKFLKTSEFSLLLKKLQYNLYIRKDGQEIPGEYKQYFEEVYSIEEFKEKTNQLLFTGSLVSEQIENKQTMLGLYATQKEGTEFNLRAWINVDSKERQIMTKGDGNTTMNIQTVYALKPQYSYYFCKDYFEDMFEDVLKDCGVVYLHNIELSRIDNPLQCYVEIDNVVKKQDGTLVYIENKTTMNRYNIEETLVEVSKFQQIMSESYPNVPVEYLMVSLYQNETVEDGYSFFTKTEGCSSADFYIPVARFNEVKLHCIVEPEYNKLKEKMMHLLK